VPQEVTSRAAERCVLKAPTHVEEGV
jgi:hypothetical protein